MYSLLVFAFKKKADYQIAAAVAAVGLDSLFASMDDYNTFAAGLLVAVVDDVVAVVQAEALDQIGDPFAGPFAVEPVVFAVEIHDDDAVAADEIDAVVA